MPPRHSTFKVAELLWAAILLITLEIGSCYKPHILFVVMDDLGSHDLGMHGTEILTPTADALARHGKYLSNYYVLPSCSPTRTSILSGRYPLHTGINNWIAKKSTIGLPLDEETLPEILGTVGYTRHAVGKWHAGHSMWEQTPTYRGFESFYGFYMGSQDYFTHESDGEEGYDFRMDEGENCGPLCSQIIDVRGNYSSPLFANEASRKIENHSKSNGPLFLYLAFQAVHSPTEVPQSYIDKYTDKDWSRTRKVYAGMLTAADEALGQVIGSLKQNGLWNETLVVYTTDNGGPTETCAVQGSSNYPKRGGKCTIWQGGTTGDGMVSGPALRTLGILPGTSTDLFHCVDWLPTLASIAGAIPTSKALDGVDQLTTLRGGESARDELFIGRTDNSVGVHGPAFRFRQWKIIEGDGGRPDGRDQPNVTNDTTYLLFNLENDPEELYDVSMQNPDILQRLQKKLAAYKATGVPQAANDPSCPWPGFVETEMGPTWMPWCGNASRIVLYS